MFFRAIYGFYWHACDKRSAFHYGQLTNHLKFSHRLFGFETLSGLLFYLLRSSQFDSGLASRVWNDLLLLLYWVWKQVYLWNYCCTYSKWTRIRVFWSHTKRWLIWRKVFSAWCCSVWIRVEWWFPLLTQCCSSTYMVSVGQKEAAQVGNQW